MGVASLLGKAIKEGVEYADNLLDVGKAQTKKIDIDVSNTPNVKGGYWDEELWIEQHPHPIPDYDPKTATPEEKKKSRAWDKLKNNAKARYITDEQKAEEAARRFGKFNERAWLARDPVPHSGIPQSQLTPEQLRDKQAHKARKSIALKRANQDGYDELGDAIPDPDAWDSTAWEADNPMPYPDIRQKDLDPEQLLERKAWIRRKANANPANKPTVRHLNHKTKAERTLRDSPISNAEKMKEAYALADQLERITGVKMDVDHLLPLQGDYVSGLHHQDNLFVLPSSINRAKGNSYDPERYAAIPSSAQRLTSLDDHNTFMTGFSNEIAEAIARKQQAASGAAERLNHEIIDPTTKVGRNARQLWGDDYERYAEDIRKQIGLLGV